MGPDNPNSCNRTIDHAENSTNCVIIPSSPLSLVFERPAAGVGDRRAKLAPQDLVRRGRKAPLNSRFKKILEQPNETRKLDGRFTGSISRRRDPVSELELPSPDVIMARLSQNNA
jgi:hypothetical protein